MSEGLMNPGPGRSAARLSDWCRGWLTLAFRQRTFGTALVASLVAALYWGLIASDRYVSEARVVVQRTDLAASEGFSLGSLLGASSAANQHDQLLLRDHLLSIDMLKKLDAKLNLRAHFSDQRRDPVSRMWLEDASLERFHLHYLSRVSVEYDDFSSVLSIRAQAYDPKMAHAIATMLVEEGENFMNALAHRLARDQVIFLESQATEMQKRVLQARQTVLSFQNRNGLVSPQNTAENLAVIISRLEAQSTQLQTRRSAMLGYLMPDSAGIVELDLQIGAIGKQADLERARLASSGGKPLNSTVEEFQRLQMDAEFAQDVYRTTLVALEQGRVESTRTLKKVSVLQHPFEPQYPIEPRRSYNTLVFALLALLLAGVIQLLAAIVRDHKD